MEEKKDNKKPFKIPPLLSNERIEAIKAEIADIKKMLNSSDENRKSDIGYFSNAATHLDVDEVNKGIKARERMLRKMTPVKLTGESSNKALAYAKKLDAWIQTHIPKETFIAYPREKDPVGKEHEFEKAVQRQMDWMKNGQRAIDTYHYLMRRIDPDAPPKDFNKLVRERA